MRTQLDWTNPPQDIPPVLSPAEVMEDAEILDGEHVRTRWSPEGPYEAGVPLLSGILEFPCCGEKWRVQGPTISVVKCPLCGNIYTFALKFAQVRREDPFLPGTPFRVVEAFEVHIRGFEGDPPHHFRLGEVYVIASDPFKVFERVAQEILLEVPISGDHETGGRSLIISVPQDKFEMVENGTAEKV